MAHDFSRRAFGASAVAAPLILSGSSAPAGTPGGSFLKALHADGPAPDRKDKMSLYGWLVGRWETEIVAYEENGAKHTSHGEILADWVLEGRAIQDVWMTPPRTARNPALPLTHVPVTGSWYGTTLRVYDPRIDAWHIFWSDPATQFYARQIGRARGEEIVQEGKLESGAVLRWSFTKIKPGSFHWLGEVSSDGGVNWRLQVEVLARRV
jgi:hypothetical protein